MALHIIAYHSVQVASHQRAERVLFIIRFLMDNRLHAKSHPVS